MKYFLAPLLLASVVLAADMGMNIHGSSYNFGYNTGDAGGHSRSESGHGGTVSGAYSYVDANGHMRRVTYTAGPDGFKPSGDIGVDRNTAAQAAAIAAMAPRAPIPHAPVAHHGAYIPSHYNPIPAIHPNVYIGNQGYMAKW